MLDFFSDSYKYFMTFALIIKQNIDTYMYLKYYDYLCFWLLFIIIVLLFLAILAEKYIREEERETDVKEKH